MLPIQIGFVLLGLIGSLAVAQAVAERRAPTRTAHALLPWAVLVVALAAAAAWIFMLPMDMRGTGMTA